MSSSRRFGLVNILQEFSIPLLSGVAAALLSANLWPEWYHHAIHWRPFGDVSVFGHVLDLHFIVNDIFMVFFFGVAAKEITESCLPGGTLNPPAKAFNPLLATVGGVVGPIGVFIAGLWLMFHFGYYDPTVDDADALLRGWGVPTATDIALAWLAARTIFGRGHPAVDFLLLLAVADDAIGLVIIAVFYGDPSQPAQPQWLLLVVAGMASVWALRRAGVKHWLPYIAIGGPLAWSGLILTHLHAALALVFIVPLLPAPGRDVGLFIDEDEVDVMGEDLSLALRVSHSPLHQFEHQLKPFVDFGLFFFAFSQAGVKLADVGGMTWLILISLIVGKTIGISAFGLLAVKLGFPLPDRMTTRDLLMAAYIAALGLTVALFVCTAAFQDPALLGQAKMGALFSGFVGLSAVALGRALGMQRTSGASRAGARPTGDSVVTRD